MTKMGTERLLAIAGPTASGKSALALQLAQEFGGEIICADSRTIYRGMNVGTAKPSGADRTLVSHHLLDIREPNQTYSAAEFKANAIRAVADIRARDKLPILVGGTGLYLWSVLYDYRFPAGARESLRMELERVPLAELVHRLQAQDPERAASIDLKNARRVIRALETVGQPQRAPKALRSATFIIGINPPTADLEDRIAARTRAMLEHGLIEEVRGLITGYDHVIEPFNTVGYRETIEFIQGKHDQGELESLINLRTRQLAKRQLTWLKRNPDILWAANAEDGLVSARKLLAG